MDALSKIQDDIVETISKGKINFKKSPRERITRPYLESRLDNLEKQWQTFCDTHREMVIDVDEIDFKASKYYKNCVYELTEELYIEYKSELKDSLLKLRDKSESDPFYDAQSPSNECTDKTFTVKLPKITIPTFSGHYSEWTSFRDLFVSLIHKNSHIDDVQKLHYLKCYVSGDAEQLLRHVPIADKNYDICWNLLRNRYDNKKYISNNILKRFMGQKSLQIESSTSIKELLDTMNECLSALQNIGVDVSSWDIIVIHIMSQKLDAESRKQWESKANESDDLPSLNIFRSFLEHKFRSLEFLDSKVKSNVNKQNVNYVISTNSVNNTGQVNKILVCPFCKAGHTLSNCNLFAKESYDTRRNFVQTNKLCYNCFGNHSVYACRQNIRCRICKRKHNSLLHLNIGQSIDAIAGTSFNNSDVIVSTATTSQDDNEEVVTCFSNISSQVLLATALVNVKLRRGTSITLRCLLDQGSQASFITESAVQQLGLQKIPNNVLISGVGGNQESLTLKSTVAFKLNSLHDPSCDIAIKAHVLGKLTSFLPPRKVILQPWSELSYIKLADPKFDVPNRIDLLLGAEVYSQILLDGLIRGPPGSLVAQNTRLGWILFGKIVSETPEDIQHVNTIISTHTLCDQNEMLRKFWELESDTFTMDKMLTEEEQKCEEIFRKTTTRDATGRYIVKLPFKDKQPRCLYGHLEEIAAKRFYWLERRLLKNQSLKDQYCSVMQEYLDLGHMELVPENQRYNSNAVYLPHHAVVKEDRITTKVRVVFDASCKGVNNISLNNDLMVGPRIQLDLRHIIMRWRQHPICLVADIVKMYRQVKVNESDIDFQRIYWRDDINSELQHYRLLRVTFGTASAPYLAVRALQQLAYDEGDQFKIAAERIINDFYVDDLMTGCQNIEECMKVYNEMNEIMTRGGFQLQKWDSNSCEFLKLIGGERSAKDKKIEDSELKLEIDVKVKKVLGLIWNNVTDEFVYIVNLPPLSEPVTKRKVISDISRLYDPMGWISPTIIKAKIFIQKLWIAGIDWDQELPHELLKEWITYRNDLINFSGFRIPRWIHTKQDDIVAELHGFCDASNDAYAAVVYIRVIDNQGIIHVSLVTSKTKVSPIKQVSIPRLELCGAQLLTKLLLEVSHVLNIPKNHIHAWTDSSVVLAWLSSHPSRWKTFIANRTSEILTSFDRNQWFHIQSQENPADCASRGVMASHCSEFQLWKHGPAWLLNETIKYNSSKDCNEDTTCEERTIKVKCAMTYIDDDELFSRFSSLRKLVRIVAICRRFCRLCSKIKTDFPIWLTNMELKEALNICIKRCQGQTFGDEINCVNRSGYVNKKSKLACLNPFLDSDGILRVGGRLSQAHLSEDIKHPIILLNKSSFTDLIIANAHINTLHGGPQLMLNYIRSKYWIINGKNSIKFFVRRCVVCIRHSQQTTHPMMGQLPVSRITPGRAFRDSGVDYAGPIAIRTSKGRGHHSTKGYICLFICMATKAIHLEAVSDLTSEGFLAAFRRFSSRRGHCYNLWSDNGSNFVGAERELRVLLSEEQSTVASDIANWLSVNGTSWHKIPPYSPNFGGLWEAGVKSTKHHLKRVIGTSTLTFEEISTVLSQIEACLNSRPLTQITDNVNDPFPLTPGHFLIGEQLLLVPDSNYESSTVSSLRRWQLTQKMVQHFWRRWSQEYITQLMHRYKWNRLTVEPKVGDVVLVKEDDLPPARWLYGVITDKHAGSDQVTRVVSLKCKGTIIKRPVSKLCVLPVTS